MDFKKKLPDSSLLQAQLILFTEDTPVLAKNVSGTTFFVAASSLKVGTLKSKATRLSMSSSYQCR